MRRKQLRLESISLAFGENILFTNLDYVFTPGIYAFSGPSGVGKTTLMRMIAGLERGYTGSIFLEEFEGEELESKNMIIGPCPEIHMVHQHYYSFPWLNLEKNVLMVHKGHKTKITPKHIEEARDILNRVGLGEHINKRPTQISGGQAQRLCIARALVDDSSFVYCYDEPTSALDDVNDMLVVELIKEHQQKYNTIEIIISHEQHVIDELNPTIIEFTPEFRLRPPKGKL